MISPEKTDEIKGKLKKGYPSGELKEELRNEGYSEEDINKCFKTHSYDMRSWYLFFGLATLAAGLWYLNLHLMLFSAGLFIAYFYELKRQKRSSR